MAADCDKGFALEGPGLKGKKWPSPVPGSMYGIDAPEVPPPGAQVPESSSSVNQDEPMRGRASKKSEAQRLNLCKGPLGKAGWLFLPLLASILVLAGCTGRNLISWGSGWSPTATASSGDEVVVYVGTKQGEVLALYASEKGGFRGKGEVKWGFSPEGEARLGGVFGAPAIGEKLVYVGGKGDSDGKGAKLYALRKNREDFPNIQTDKGEWKKDIERAIVGGPALAEAEGLVLVGSDNGVLYAFDAVTGKMAWSFPTGGQIWSTPAVGDGVVYFGSMDSYIYALSLQEGLDQASRLLWRYKTGGAVVARPLLLEGMVILGSFDRKIYALKANTSNPEGELVWLQPFEGDDWFWAGAVSDGNYIFASSMGSTVYALDKKGAPVWHERFKEGSPIVSTPVVVGDSLVVATDEGKLYKLSTSSGEQRESFKDLGGRVKAPLSQDGAMVFVGVEDSTVRLVNVERWVEVWEVSTKE